MDAKKETGPRAVTDYRTHRIVHLDPYLSVSYSQDPSQHSKRPHGSARKKKAWILAAYTPRKARKNPCRIQAQETHARNAQYLNKDRTPRCRTLGRQLAYFLALLLRPKNFANFRGSKATIRSSANRHGKGTHYFGICNYKIINSLRISLLYKLYNLIVSVS